MSQDLKLCPQLQTPLNLGEYTIRAKQLVSVPAIFGPAQIYEPIDVERKFVVVGPRFVLESDQILNTFPPPNTNGDYNNFLPYLAIRRATLPWERQINATYDEHPFLALLIVSESELAHDVRVKSQRIADFCLERSGMTADPNEDPDTYISVVEADGVLLKSLLPSLADLKLLAHVRQRGDEPQEAVLLGNRRPLPNTRYSVHVVSLEGLNPETLTTGLVKLPSLYRWEFTCGLDKMGLVERLEELHCDGLRLPERKITRERPNTPSTSFHALRHDGYAAMPYRMAWGDRTHALYRGPLLPVEIAENLELSINRAAGLDSSEGLVDYFTNLGLTDISLAAAWELGRMLMLRRRAVAMDYYRFRRQQAGLAHQETNAAKEQHLVVHDVPPRQVDAPPKDVRAFCGELIQLIGVPFPYLVPEPRMLPQTSLRVFRLDRRWIACLLGGALSLGRSRTVDRQRESVYLTSLLSGVGDRSGVFIRSAAISEYPNQTYVFENAAGEPLKILRRERFALDVLFVLVDGVLEKIKASEEPQSAHFGFKEGGGSGEETFKKDMRNPTTFQEIDNKTVVVDSSYYRPGNCSILDVDKLAAKFEEQSPLLILKESHHFALQLIESGARSISIPLGGI